MYLSGITLKALQHHITISSSLVCLGQDLLSLKFTKHIRHGLPCVIVSVLTLALETSSHNHTLEVTYPVQPNSLALLILCTIS